MRDIIFFLFVFISIFNTPQVFADTAANSDFNPFPQMEQDQKDSDGQIAPQPDQQDDNNGSLPDNGNYQNSESQNE